MSVCVRRVDAIHDRLWFIDRAVEAWIAYADGPYGTPAARSWIARVVSSFEEERVRLLAELGHGA
jgi:hypothetical protein